MFGIPSAGAALVQPGSVCYPPSIRAHRCFQLPACSLLSVSVLLNGQQASITQYRLFVKARLERKSPPQSLAYWLPQKRLAPAGCDCSLPSGGLKNEQPHAETPRRKSLPGARRRDPIARTRCLLCELGDSASLRESFLGFQRLFTPSRGEGGRRLTNR